MCSAAPNNSKCKLEENDAIMCHARRLEAELYELKKEIPILRLFNSPCRCEYFEARGGDGDGN